MMTSSTLSLSACRKRAFLGAAILGVWRIDNSTHARADAAFIFAILTATFWSSSRATNDLVYGNRERRSPFNGSLRLRLGQAFLRSCQPEIFAGGGPSRVRNGNLFFTFAGMVCLLPGETGDGENLG